MPDETDQLRQILRYCIFKDRAAKAKIVEDLRFCVQELQANEEDCDESRKLLASLAQLELDPAILTLSQTLVYNR